MFDQQQSAPDPPEIHTTGRKRHSTNQHLSFAPEPSKSENVGPLPVRPLHDASSTHEPGPSFPTAVAPSGDASSTAMNPQASSFPHTPSPSEFPNSFPTMYANVKPMIQPYPTSSALVPMTGQTDGSSGAPNALHFPFTAPSATSAKAFADPFSMFPTTSFGTANHFAMQPLPPARYEQSPINNSPYFPATSALSLYTGAQHPFYGSSPTTYGVAAPQFVSSTSYPTTAMYGPRAVSVTRFTLPTHTSSALSTYNGATSYVPAPQPTSFFPSTSMYTPPALPSYTGALQTYTSVARFPNSAQFPLFSHTGRTASSALASPSTLPPSGALQTYTSAPAPSQFQVLPFAGKMQQHTTASPVSSPALMSYSGALQTYTSSPLASIVSPFQITPFVGNGPTRVMPSHSGALQPYTSSHAVPTYPGYQLSPYTGPVTDTSSLPSHSTALLPYTSSHSVPTYSGYQISSYTGPATDSSSLPTYSGALQPYTSVNTPSIAGQYQVSPYMGQSTQMAYSAPEPPVQTSHTFQPSPSLEPQFVFEQHPPAPLYEERYPAPLAYQTVPHESPYYPPHPSQAAAPFTHWRSTPAVPPRSPERYATTTRDRVIYADPARPSNHVAARPIEAKPSRFIAPSRTRWTTSPSFEQTPPENPFRNPKKTAPRPPMGAWDRGVPKKIRK